MKAKGQSEEVRSGVVEVMKFSRGDNAKTGVQMYTLEKFSTKTPSGFGGSFRAVAQRDVLGL